MTKTFDTSSTLKRPPAKNEVKDGQTRFAFHDGALYQYSKYNNELYAMKYFPHMSQMADVILNDETVVRAQHSFTGDPIFEPGLGSKGYQTGWTASGGTGYKIYKDGSEYHAEFDGLIVRGTMRVFELLLQQIRATNGSIFVTSAAKADAVTGSAGTETITFEDPNEETTGGVCPFIEDDIILSQRFNIGSTDVVTRKVRRVASVSGKSVTVASDVTGQPSTAADVIVAAGDDFVRVGSTTNAARRGGIYMSSDDPNSPFIVIFDGVTSWSDWTSNDKTKARLGRLDSIDDDTAGLDGNQTNEFGLYSDSVYLKGHINATSGKIGGVNMSGSTIYTGGGNYNNSDTGFYLSNAGNMSLKDKFTWDGSTLSVSGSITVTGGNAETTTGSQTKATAAQVAATAAAATDATSKADSAEDAAKAASLLRASYLTSNTTTINGGTITTGSIAADRIAANSITADQIDTANITAAVVTTESVNAKTITADAINLGTATISGTLAASHVTAVAITSGSININDAATIDTSGNAVFSSVTATGQIVSNSGSSSWTDGSLTGGTIGGSSIESGRIVIGSEGAGQLELVHTGDTSTTWLGVVEGGSGPAQTPWRILANGNTFFQYDAIQMSSGQNLELLCNYPTGGIANAAALDGGLILKDMSEDIDETGKVFWKIKHGLDDSNLMFSYHTAISSATRAFLEATGDWVIDGYVDEAYSDVRLKTNLVPMSNSLDRVMEMKPYDFDWVEERGGEHDTGLLAQDMLEMMPEIVSKGADQIHYSIRYKKLIPTLINAIQELQKEVEELKNAQA